LRTFDLSNCHGLTLNVLVELTAFEVHIHEALGSNVYSDGVVLSGECQDDDG